MGNNTSRPIKYTHRGLENTIDDGGNVVICWMTEITPAAYGEPAFAVVTPHCVKSSNLDSDTNPTAFIITSHHVIHFVVIYPFRMQPAEQRITLIKCMLPLPSQRNWTPAVVWNAGGFLLQEHWISVEFGFPFSGKHDERVNDELTTS